MLPCNADTVPLAPFPDILEYLYCLSRINLNSLVFTIRQQLVNRKSEPTLLPTQGIFNLPHHIDMVWEQLAFDDAVSYTQRWKSKLAEVMAWVIEPPTFRLGVWLQNKVRHPNHSATEDATQPHYPHREQTSPRPIITIESTKLGIDMHTFRKSLA